MPKKTQDNTIEEVIEPTQEKINYDTEIIENPEEVVEKKYVVLHDFKDLRDNNIIYIKGDIYPRRALSNLSLTLWKAPLYVLPYASSFLM